MRNPDPFYTEREAAEYLHISVYWLQKVRSRKLPGPTVTRIGGAVRYRQSALESFASNLPTNAAYRPATRGRN